MQKSRLYWEWWGRDEEISHVYDTTEPRREGVGQEVDPYAVF